MPTDNRYDYDPDLIAANLRTIDTIPPDILDPRDLAHLALRWLAWGGWDCYAYQSGGPGGTWCAWLEPLADVRAGRDGRVSLDDWRAHWSDLLCEMGIVRAEEGTVRPQ